MLKIKDNVDLEELVKFGFKKSQDYYDFIDRNEGSCIDIYCDNKHIEISTIYGIKLGKVVADVVLNKLYDLIQADLVEKVSD